MNEEVQVQKGATLADIVADHVSGMGGYAIAEKYGLDTDKVKQIINEADRNLAFVPAKADGTKEAPIDAVEEPLIAPLPEGAELTPGSSVGHK